MERWDEKYVTATAAKLLQSCLTLCNPIDGSHQAPPSMGFSRQEYCSGLPLPSPEKYVEVVAILFCLGCKSLMRIWVQGRGGESEIRSCTELSPSQRAIILLKE